MLSLRFLFLPLFLFSCLALSAQQRKCAAFDRHLHFYESDSSYRRRYDETRLLISRYAEEHRGAADSIITIPVVVHVLWNTDEQNIPDNQIKSQIDILNEDYAAENSNIVDVPSVWQQLAKDTKIRFCLARRDRNGNPFSGILRINTNVSTFDILDPRIFATTDGGSEGWPGSSYMNLWVCNLAQNVLGFASFPGTMGTEDGVVINYRALGRIGKNTKSPYNFGRTSTHEVGHWLSLLHIWGDDGGTCQSDDNISDTPKQADADYGCPSFPVTDACNQSSPGIMFMNYMDYTDDRCMSFFTSGQGNAMYSSIMTVRDSMLISPGKLYGTVSGTEAAIDSVISPRISVAQQCFNPALRIMNYGTDTLHRLEFIYRLNEGLPKHFVFTSVIAPGTTSIVTLPEIASTYDDRILEIQMILNDSVKADNYVSISLRVAPGAINNCVKVQPYVYPNPVGSTRLACLKTGYDESRMVELRVYDLSGREVLSRNLEVNPGDAIAMDMRMLQSGMYIAELHSDISTETIKFMYLPESNSSRYIYSCN